MHPSPLIVGDQRDSLVCWVHDQEDVMNGRTGDHNANVTGYDRLGWTVRWTIVDVRPTTAMLEIKSETRHPGFEIAAACTSAIGVNAHEDEQRAQSGGAVVIRARDNCRGDVACVRQYRRVGLKRLNQVAYRLPLTQLRRPIAC
jgi:hypothetical protein